MEFIPNDIFNLPNAFDIIKKMPLPVLVPSLKITLKDGLIVENYRDLSKVEEESLFIRYNWHKKNRNKLSVDKYKDIIFKFYVGYLIKYSKNHSELFPEFIMRLYRCMDLHDVNSGRFIGYLSKSLSNKVKEIKRKKSHITNSIDKLNISVRPKENYLDDLNILLGKLSAEQREILEAKFGINREKAMSHKEITEKFHLSSSSISRVRIYRLIKQMQNMV